MARRTAVLDAQPSLFDDEQPPTPPTTPSQPERVPPKRRRLRTHTLGLPRPWTERIPCAAACLVCGRPDGLGVCPDGACAVVCGRPDKTGPVEVCLLTLVVVARRGGLHAVVSCPHCDGIHWHQPALGRRYRVGQCGQPYIVNLPATKETRHA